jgi:Tfp pilus assembly protein PilP
MEQDLVINQDGSGTLDMRYVLSEAFLKAAGFERPEMEDVLNKGVCLSERGLREQFGGEGVKIVSSHFEWREGAVDVSFTLTFSSFTSLLKTKAFQNSAVVFYRNDKGNLAFRLDGYRILGDSVDTKKLTEMLPQTFEAFTRVTLPSLILENNADSIEDTVLSWHYAKNKLSPESMTAVCEGTGLAFLATLPVGPRGKSGAQYVYSPFGKRDPFKPWILEIRARADKKASLHPLQRYDISQLKLVAVIRKGDDPKAMLQDATGKGFIVTKGSQVGGNEGVIVDITDTEIVIVEKAINLLGETKTKEVRISLHQEERESK